MRKLILLAVVTVIGCTQPDPGQPADPSEPVVATRTASEVGEPFTLAPGQERGVPSIDLVVRFVDVPVDHRCPLEVDCVWEGDAEVVVLATQDGDAQTFHLHAPRDLIGPTAADLPSGHRLELVRLQPERPPESGIPLGDYRATFRVTTPED